MRWATEGPIRVERGYLMTATSKITYTSANVDLDAFHAQFDDGLARIRAQSGADHPLYIDGATVAGSLAPIADTSPIDLRIVLGRFAAAGQAEVDRAVTAASRAQRAWAHRPWQERVACLCRAAALIRERKFDLAALMSLEVGNSRLESMGDAEESADLIDYYCSQMEDAGGFRRTMAAMTPVERNTEDR